MDSMTVAKYGGAGCAMLLAYLVLNAVSHDALFHPEELEVAAYSIETTDEGGGDAAAEEPSMGELLASADLDDGAKVFKKCSACHKVEAGVNGVGPSLWNVLGRDIASADGFAYSDDLSSKEGDWTWDKLDAFLANPKSFAPGTKMAFAGLKKAEDRANVMAYLNQAGDAPIDLPEVETAAEPMDAAVETASAEVEGAVETASDAAEGAAAEAAGETAGEAGPNPELLAEGENVFKKCRACHKLEEGKHGVGPSLAGVVGSDIASAEGYKYSDALSEKEGVWDVANLDAFLTKPRDWAPGTKMSFPGLADEADRAAVILYLENN